MVPYGHVSFLSSSSSCQACKGAWNEVWPDHAPLQAWQEELEDKKLVVTLEDKKLDKRREE
jgi:hypothetical protein